MAIGGISTQSPEIRTGGDRPHAEPATGNRPAAGQNRPEAEADRGGSSVEQRRQKAFETVEATLTRGYEKLAESSGNGAEAYAEMEPLSAEKVAGNVLGFIGQRLQQDAASGASAEELEARLDEGLEGFEQGFAEAREQLEPLSRLTPDIETDIDSTRDRVLSGVEDLRSQILDDAFDPSGLVGGGADPDDAEREA